MQGWAERAETPWESVEGGWYGGQRQQRWGFSHTALWSSRGVPAVNSRSVRVCDPEGRLRMDACFCTDLQAAPVPMLEGVVMRWSVEVTVEEARAHLGVETQRQGSDGAIARTTPVLLALFSSVTLVALPLSQDGPIPVHATAWDHKAEPTFADGWALVRRHLWRARYWVPATPEAEIRPWPREALEILRHSLPLAA